MDEAQEDRDADMRLARQLLRGGVGRRHVRRALRELGDHREDLVAGMLAAGQERATAVRDARQLLGDRAVLAARMIARPELRSRTRRFAWLLFGLAPMPLFCFAGLLAMFGAAAVFEGINFLTGQPRMTETQAMAIGRPLLLWVVPVLVGLLLCWLAVRHRVAAFWPICAVCIVAWCSGLTFYGHVGGVTTVAFGMLPRFRSALPEYVRICTLFCALGASYLLLLAAQQRRIEGADAS
jgi:hypothetical protein